MKPRFLAIAVLLLTCTSALSSFGQQSLPPVRTVVVLPFENRSAAPGLEWIAEAFPEVLGQRLVSDNLYVLSREYRLHAYDRAGIPTTVRPSLATLYRIVEQMDVDYAVVGSYTFDGQTFSARAQLLDIKQRHLFPEVKESGPLTQLLAVQTALAWDLLRALQPDYGSTRSAFLAAAPTVRLDAFENYIRGLIALSESDKLQHLRAAVRINPAYTEAILELGKTYFEAHDYDAAALWLARIPQTDPLAREADFFLGLAAYFRGDYARADSSFRYLLQQFPLIEVYNNLGAVSARLGKPEATQLFQKAVDADPSDPDYRFNLGVALLRAGDVAGASRQLKECLALRPDDSEAKSLLATISGQAPPAPTIKPANENDGSQTAAAPKIPLERVKRNYDETAFRQLAIELQNASESRLAKLDPRSHAAYHVRRGRDLLAKGFPADAEKELREAVELDAGNAMAHAALAQALMLDNNAAAARTEADAALQLNPSADVYVVLAALKLSDNNRQGALELVQRALQLDPRNADALQLQQKLGAAAAPAGTPQP